jgi:hypothetical protein
MIVEHTRLESRLVLCSGADSKVADDFEAALVIAYERAMEEGMRPDSAIGIVLNWLTVEFMRCTPLPTAIGE